MMGLGSMVGTGVVVSIGIAAGVAGPAVILAIILAAGIATCNALSGAQLAASHAATRSPITAAHVSLRVVAIGSTSCFAGSIIWVTSTAMPAPKH